MIKHIVFFKLSDSVPAQYKKAELQKLEKIFSPLGKKFPFIMEFRTGVNFNDTDNAWDFAIDSIFKNRDDLQSYQESKEHQEAIIKGSVIEKSKAVIDYEF
jgi:Stress responsive A/B Barrel Domain